MIDEKHVSTEALGRLARGTAPAEEKMELLNHLTVCPSCMERFAGYFGQMEQIKPSADFISQTAERIRAQDKRNVIPRRKGRGELLRYSVRVSAAACAALILLFTQSWAFYGGYHGQGQEKWWQGSPGQALLEKPMEKIKASEWTFEGLSDYLFKRGGNEK